MSLCFYLFGEVYLFYYAILINDEGRTKGAHIRATIHALFAPYAHGLYELLVGVGNEGEGEFVFVDKLLVRCGAIDAHSYHLVASLAKFAITIA